MSKQGRIVSVFKGFYIIVPPNYQNMGVLPAVMFIDDLMCYLNRPYYLSLLTAASLHGAAHQGPQSHFVCTTLPTIRTTRKNGIQIEYISKRNFLDQHIVQKKTESGFVKVSDPVLTSIDMMNYHKSIGGINRAATIINELSEEIAVEQIENGLTKLCPIADLQRLGYLWENVLERSDLADELYEVLNRNKKIKRKYRLSSSREALVDAKKNRWKINPNLIIEIDE